MLKKDVFENLKDNKEILALALSLASMVLTSDSDQQWLEGEVAMLEDILRDTWFYQKILKEGREEGREDGIEQERKRELQRWSQALVSSIETKFPTLVPLARKCANMLDDPDASQKVLLQILNTNDIDRARSYLQAASEEKVV